MRAVELINYKPGDSTGRYATFLQFGQDFEEFESGPGNYTVAIIELSDGTVTTISPTGIRFIKDVNGNMNFKSKPKDEK